MTELRKQLIQQVFSITSKFEDVGIPYSLNSCTLLAQVRHGELFQHNQDPVQRLLMRSEDIPRAQKILNVPFQNNDVNYVGWGRCATYLYTEFHKRGFLYEREGQEVIPSLFTTGELIRVSFESMEVSIMQNQVEWLKWYYGPYCLTHVDLDNSVDKDYSKVALKDLTDMSTYSKMFPKKEFR